MMSDQTRYAFLIEGVLLGVVLATGVSLLVSKYMSETHEPSNRRTREKDGRRHSNRNTGSTSRSRSQSPHRRQNTRCSPGYGRGIGGTVPEICTEAAPLRSPPVFPSTPRTQLLQREMVTDDEAPFVQQHAYGSLPSTSDDVPSDVPTVSRELQHVLIRPKTSTGITKHIGSYEHKGMKIDVGRGLETVNERTRTFDDPDLREDYCRVITPENSMSEEAEDTCFKLLEAMKLREKWFFQMAEYRKPANKPNLVDAVCPGDIPGFSPFTYDPLPPSDFHFNLENGVFQIHLRLTREKAAFLPGLVVVIWLTKLTSLASVKGFCYQRLMLLEQKFNLHVMMNADTEAAAQKSAAHRDFYNVRKVDTHVHHAACMHQKHLLRFIKSKLKKEPNEVVIFRDGKYLTLKEVFESLQLTSHLACIYRHSSGNCPCVAVKGYDLNVDMLDMHVDKSIFHRFDKFNLKYNPFGQSRLREIFIKQENLIHGRYLAELTKQVFEDLQNSKYQHAEYRISIYGSRQVEWDILSSWICKHQLFSNNVVWLIQIPRLYNVYRTNGMLSNFEDMLRNIFQPLFEVTHDPSSHPQLHMFLKQVVGFDTVDDESRSERRVVPAMPFPKDWKTDQNPPYAYYAFYIYANLYILNKFRELRGLNTFAFRPHCGEAGDSDHLACAFMMCDNISHGINLRRVPPLQYLYYLSQIGICMSPLSNNSLFLDYHKNPFPIFFARGLNVSLSTDDPLQIHLTREPLVEEYSIAAQVWKLSSTDLCEIARNSVLHSGFPDECKKHWIAEYFWLNGPEGNDIQRTNVPNLRLRFRLDTHKDEMQMLYTGMHQYKARQDRSDMETSM